MKNVFILLLFAQLVSAQRNIDPGFFVDTDPTRILAGMADPAITFNADCEWYQDYSEWSVNSVSDPTRFCIHQWVYAERSDVNQSSGITNAVYCHCGCPQSENEARICSVCLRHETRVRSWGWAQKPKQESEYMKLKKQIPDSQPLSRIVIGPGAGVGAIVKSAGGPSNYFLFCFTTGKKPAANQTIFSIDSEFLIMNIGAPDSPSPEGDSFRRDMAKFYVVKSQSGFDVKSMGALPELETYSIKINIQ